MFVFPEHKEVDESAASSAASLSLGGSAGPAHGGVFSPEAILRRSGSGRPHDHTLLKMVAAWVMVAACAACAVELIIRAVSGDGVFSACLGASFREVLWLIGGLLWGSIEAGVVEEALFRGVLLALLLKVLVSPRLGLPPRRALLVGAIVSSLVFGAAHVATSFPPNTSAAFINPTVPATQTAVAAPIVPANAPVPTDSAAYAPVSASSSAFGAYALVFPLTLLPFSALALKFFQTALFGFCMASLAIARGSLLVPVVLHAAFDLVYFMPAYLTTGSFPESYAFARILDAGPLVVTILLFLPPTFACAKALRALVVALPSAEIGRETSAGLAAPAETGRAVSMGFAVPVKNAAGSPLKSAVGTPSARRAVSPAAHGGRRTSVDAMAPASTNLSCENDARHPRETRPADGAAPAEAEQAMSDVAEGASK